MKRSEATPARLVGLIILSTLLVAGTFLVIPNGSHYRGGCYGGFLGFSFLSHLIGMFMLFGVGGYLGWWAYLELTCGIRLERWNEEQLRTMRKLSQSWPAQRAPFMLLGLGVISFLFETCYLNHTVSLGFWICFVLNYGVAGVLRSLAPPRSAEQTTSWLHSSAPLQSDHWGNRS